MDRTAPASAELLEKIEREPPFDDDGRLRAELLAAIGALGTFDAGPVMAALVVHAARLEPGRTAAAAQSLDAVVDNRRTWDAAAGSDPRGLVTAWATTRREGAAQLNSLIVRILRSLGLAAARGALVDAGLSRLLPELEAAFEADGPETADAIARRPAAEAVTPDVSPSRGIDFDRFDRTSPPRSSPRRGGIGAWIDRVSGGRQRAEPTIAMTPSPAPAARPAAPEQPAPTGPGAPRTHQAYGLLACDETVRVGRPFDLLVGLSNAPSAGVSGAPMDLPPVDDVGYDLDVQLFADGFDLAVGQAWRNALRVRNGARFPTVTLTLTARPAESPPATRSIKATFAIDNKVLGAATRDLRVVDAETPIHAAATVPHATGANIAAPTGDPPADLTITITHGDERGVLLWGIESRIDGVALETLRPPRSDVGQDPETFAQEIIVKLFAKGSGHGMLQLLQGIGKAIRGHIPPEVRAAIHAAGTAVAPQPLDVLLLTEDPYVPWELAWVDEPFDPAAPAYLGAQVNLGRWVLDGGTTPTDPPRHLDASTMAVVWGVYDRVSKLRRLEAAEAEAADILEAYGGRSIDATNEPVLDLLGGKPPADILHFAVHGRYNPDGVEEGMYMLDGTTIDPLIVGGSNLADRAPFVFLNACQVGSGQNLLGSYSGIAQAFLQVGASAVVAPLWSIDDVVARKIATEFYVRALARGDRGSGDAANVSPAVADLLRQARSGLVKDAAAPSATYLAYQFYGHPSLRLSWSGQSSGPGTVARREAAGETQRKGTDA